MGALAGDGGWKGREMIKIKKEIEIVYNMRGDGIKRYKADGKSWERQRYIRVQEVLTEVLTPNRYVKEVEK